MNVYSLLSVRSFLLLTALDIAIRGERPDAARHHALYAYRIPYAKNAIEGGNREMGLRPSR